MSSQRIYFLYILTAMSFALLVFGRSTESHDVRPAQMAGKFFRFLFPRSVWNDPSAWLDVRFFFFHNLIWVSMFGTLAAIVVNWAASNSTSALLAQTDGNSLFSTQNYFLGGIIYMFMLVAALDFTAFCIHYLQHKVPVLWAFHKVHHSATVLHPLTNYREHPVDNVFYIVGTGLAAGSVAGFSYFLFGAVFHPPTIVGLTVLSFAFNFLAYNLRHSHIWLRWPGWLIYVFGCPAHHQVHHSCHPDHIDKNFAFMFPVWDVLFGTFILPGTNKDVKFGLGNGEESDFRTCLGLYLVPFQKLWKQRRRKLLTLDD